MHWSTSLRKSFREAEQLIRSMGFKIIGSGRSKHQYWILETPGGRRFKQPIPHDTAEPRFWNNWKTQLRRQLNDDDKITSAGRAQPA